MHGKTKTPLDNARSSAIDSFSISDDGKYSAQMSFKKPSGMVKKTRTQIGASNNVSTGHASNFHAHSAANQSP